MTSLIETIARTPADIRRPSFPINYGGQALTGLAIILTAFGGLAAWSATAPLSTAAIAAGTVVVDSNRKTVQHLQGGIVRDILVRDGIRVQEGDVLLRLDPTQSRAMSQMLQGQVDAGRAEEARLLAEREGARALAFPSDLHARARTETSLSELLSGQERLFQARRQSIEGQTSILRNRIAQSNDQISGLQLQESAKQRQMALVKQELDGLRSLAERGNAPQNKVLAFEREVEQLNADRGDILARIATVRQAIGEAELQITQTRKSFLESVETDLKNVQVRLFEVTERFNANKAELSRMEIRAPVTGVVVDMAVHSVDGVVTPGGRILDIVPEDDLLVIEAQVRPNDIDGLHIGMPADIRFPTFNRRTTPTFHGTVTRLSADRLVDPRTNVPFFSARIKIDPESKEHMTGLTVMPGMPTEVILKKGERTLMSYLMAPLEDTFIKALRE
jgi:HlyD family type I secretion membrane fusion protein